MATKYLVSGYLSLPTMEMWVDAYEFIKYMQSAPTPLCVSQCEMYEVQRQQRL